MILTRLSYLLWEQKHLFVFKYKLWKVKNEYNILFFTILYLLHCVVKYNIYIYISIGNKHTEYGTHTQYTR